MWNWHLWFIVSFNLTPSLFNHFVFFLAENFLPCDWNHNLETRFFVSQLFSVIWFTLVKQVQALKHTQEISPWRNSTCYIMHSDALDIRFPWWQMRPIRLHLHLDEKCSHVNACKTIETQTQGNAKGTRGTQLVGCLNVRSISTHRAVSLLGNRHLHHHTSRTLH